MALMIKMIKIFYRIFDDENYNGDNNINEDKCLSSLSIFYLITSNYELYIVYESTLPNLCIPHVNLLV